MSVAVNDIPHIDEYRRAYEAACQKCGPDEPPTGRQVMRRISDALECVQVDCLVCADDGDGIGPDELRALYGSGRSTKKTTGRGSVGHGHMTAFAPSDLRYVLYAGRSGDGVGTFGGHVILATHLDQNERQRSAEGYIRRRTETLTPFDNERGGKRVPDLLDPWIGDRGSAVMIVGYKPLSDQWHETGGLIRLTAATAALGFLVALHDGSLTVTIETGADQSACWNRSSLPEAVSRIRPKPDRESVERSLRTLDQGSLLNAGELGTGVRIWFRQSLDDHDPKRDWPQVAVYRDGMRIEKNTPRYLAPSIFADVRPFDAVVDLSSDPGCEFGKLVREAEGASHAKITPSELEAPDDKKRLSSLLRKLADILKENALQKEDSDFFEPHELKLSWRHPEQAKRPPPKRQPKLEPGFDELTPATNQNEGHRKAKKRKPRPAPASNTDRPPVKAGNSTGLRTSCRADPSDPALFHVTWSAAQRFRGGAAGIRLILPSGTDQSSRSPIRPEYLEIASCSIEGVTETNAPGSREFRIESPGMRGEAEVWVDPGRFAQRDGLGMDPDRGLVRAELVHRQRETDRGAESSGETGRVQP